MTKWNRCIAALLGLGLTAWCAAQTPAALAQVQTPAQTPVQTQTQALAAPTSIVAQAVPVPVGAWSNAPQPLRGWLFEPPAQATRTGAAVVMLHGCGGAYARDGALNARHQMWGQHLASQGFVALMLDSFTPRGFAEICTTRSGHRPIRESERVGDAYAALQYLRQLPQVRADSIHLLGWSHGGGVVLDSITRPPQGAPLFRSAVALYPGCSVRVQRAASFHPYVPLLLLVGLADDWTAAAPCQELTTAVQARGEPMQLHAYPDTYHDFDNPALKTLRVRKDVPNGVNPGKGVTVAPNPEAREDAKRRVVEFFQAK